MHIRFFASIRIWVAVWSIAMVLGANTIAAEWPQYRGPEHNGATPEKIDTHWPTAGPKVEWKIPLGSSLGSFITGGGKVFVYEMRGDKEACFALDPSTGKPIWSTDVDKSIFDKDGGDGPRSTPAFSDGRVYLLSTYLTLACLDASDGKVLWSHDLKGEFGGSAPHWGNAASPLIDGDMIFACGGGRGQSLLAFEKATGKLAWKSQDDAPTHASPIPADLLGVHQIIFFTVKGLVSVDPKTGDALWRAAFPFRVSTAASPVVCGDDIVYSSAGYGVGAGAFRVAKQGGRFTVSPLWRNPGGDINHWSTPVYKDGYLYGLYGFKEFHTEPLKCIDVMTGDEKWSRPGFGQGQVLLVDGNLLVQGDTGQLVLARASPESYQEIARFHPISGKCWTDPAVANGHIYVRSQTGGACLDVTPGK